jgi:O-antigen/teichoic acid export membrane protein
MVSEQATAPESLKAPKRVGKERHLGSNVLASMATSGVTVSTGLISVPLILSAVGVVGYGLWALARTMMIYAGSAEIGLGPGVQRYIGLRRGKEAETGLSSILWTALVVYGIVGGAVFAVGVALAPLIVEIFKLPVDLRSEGASMLRLVSLAILITLLAVGLGNVLQGLERFQALALSTLASSIAFICGVVVVTQAGWGLIGLGGAAVLQGTTMLVFRCWFLRHLVASERPRLLPRREIVELLSFSGRLQITAITTLLNTQTDKIVVGLVAGPVALGEIGIAAQLAEAARLFGGASIPPMVSRFALAWGAHDETRVARLTSLTVRIVTVGVIALSIIATASLYPIINAWLGSGHNQSVVFASILLLAYSCFLLCSPAIAYLRAVGRPRLEVLYGVTTTAINLFATVGLGLVFGPVGVVTATLLAYGGGAVWFLTRVRHVAPPVRIRWAVIPRLVPLAVLLGAISCAWGIWMVDELSPHIALLPAGVGCLVCMLVFFRVGSGIPLRSMVGRSSSVKSGPSSPIARSLPIANDDGVVGD